MPKILTRLWEWLKWQYYVSSGICPVCQNSNLDHHGFIDGVRRFCPACGWEENKREKNR